MDLKIKHKCYQPNKYPYYRGSSDDLSSYWTEKELKIEGKPVAIFNAFRQYQMESVLFRVFVKLGWRK